MSTQIQFSSPLLKKFTHANVTVGTSVLTLTAAADVGEKRIVVIIQNKSDSNNVEAILNSTDSVGILIPPLSTLSLDNYQGVVRAKATASGTVVHLSIASV